MKKRFFTKSLNAHDFCDAHGSSIILKTRLHFSTVGAHLIKAHNHHQTDIHQTLAISTTKLTTTVPMMTACKCSAAHSADSAL